MTSLTPIQTEILIWLSRYKYLCTDQIHSHFHKEKTVRNTEIMLARMEKKGLIHRIRTGRSLHFNFGMICYLSKQGFEWVVQNEDFGNRRLIQYPVKNAITSLNHYYHRKRLIDFFIQLDRAVNQMSDIELSCVLAEYIQMKIGSKRIVATNFSSSGISIIPDMAFVLKNKEGMESAYMVEIDTGRETIGGKFDDAPKGSIMEKCIAYEKLQFESIWRERLNTSAEAFEVLIITEKIPHGKAILNAVRRKMEFPEVFTACTHKWVETIGNILTDRCWIKYESGMRTIF